MNWWKNGDIFSLLSLSHKFIGSPAIRQRKNEEKATETDSSNVSAMYNYCMYGMYMCALIAVAKKPNWKKKKSFSPLFLLEKKKTTLPKKILEIEIKTMINGHALEKWSTIFIINS